MENDDTKNSDGETRKELPPTTPGIHTDKQAGTSSSTKKKTRQSKKWGIRRPWKAASRKQQIKWVLKGLGGLIALGLFISGIWGNLQSMWNFKAEHRPKVVLNRPPDLLGVFSCEVTDKAIYIHTGAMQVWVRNIGREDAIGAFIGGPMFKLVPDKKTGLPFYDDLPSITDESCKLTLSPQGKAFPVHRGEEVREDIARSDGTISLIDTNSVTITLGGRRKEPETPAGAPPNRVVIAKDALFQLYAPICVSYFDQNGVRYGTCRNYRFVTKGPNGPDDRSFSCTESPINGTFRETMFGYCEN